MSLIIILGPTAVGKTKLAVQLANRLNGEIISADSRQVYEGMDIGTGKDLKDYYINGKEIPHHLIDIKKAGEHYNLFDFQHDFYRAYLSITAKEKWPILCGGTGLYLEAAIAKEKMQEVPINKKLRQNLAGSSLEELAKLLVQLNPNQHNTSDLSDRNRCIRAIEIEKFKKQNPAKEPSPLGNYLIFGIKMERSNLRAQIDKRLKDRLRNGMVEEVELLLSSGLTAEQLNYYGLEYRFLVQFLTGEMEFNEMYEKLLQAIRRFAKKQMTWFRRMEKNGAKIHWMDANLSLEDKLKFVLKHLALEETA